MSKVSISAFKPTANDVLLMDTNILIYLFYPTMSRYFMKPYEKLYADILSKHASLIIPAIQLSEFINRCIRLQFELYKNEHASENIVDFKKDYRSTNDYKASMKSILDIVKNDILKTFKPIDDYFSSMKPDSFLLYGFSYDFNDALLVEIANKYNASIITHDSDFGNYRTHQKIITDNSILLKFQ